MKKGLIILGAVLLAAVIGLTALFLNDSPDNQFRAVVMGLIKEASGDTTEVQEELLAKVPRIDTEKYNRFTFSMDIMAGGKEKEGIEYDLSGHLETWKTTAHIYNLTAGFPRKGTSMEAESWEDFAKNISYQDLGEGWKTGKIKNPDAINDLAAALNTRNTQITVMDDGSVLSLSWVFPADIEYLFGNLLGQITTDREITGFGRVTAVFDPADRTFEYFTIVVSCSNSSGEGGLLDATFYWDVANGTEHALDVPKDVSASAYTAATGVKADGGYDENVNPVAEDFLELYGGEAQVTASNGSAYMFWTLKQDGGLSASINYTHEPDPVTRFEKDYAFLQSMYGEPVEETDDGAYFYSEEKGELTYMARGTDWYGEIIITGQPGISQGELRKPLITYKSRLGI